MRLAALILGTGLSALTFARVGTVSQSPESASAMVAKFLDASKMQQQALRGMQMEADIDAQLPKLKEQGRWQLLRIVSNVGRITFKKLSDFVGDKTVQHDVIEKYLQMESEASGDSSHSINTQNYKFRRKTIMTQDDKRIWVFELTPKRKAVGLFKGELWLDGTTGMPLKETGTFVKTPSIFLKKVAFVNEFKLQDGISVPSRIECHVDTRIAGRADLEIHFSNVEPTPRAEPAEVADAP